MAKKQVQFRTPPAAYYRNVTMPVFLFCFPHSANNRFVYQQESKKREILAAGFDVQKFQELGILIDSEADISTKNDQDR